METRIHTHKEDEEFYTDEGCYIIEVANTDNDPNVSIARARVEPGKSTRWHKLDGISERYLIISGEGEAEVGELSRTQVKPGDVITIPAGTRQRIHNTGSEDLVFYCVCEPRFAQSSYIDIDTMSP